MLFRSYERYLRAQGYADPHPWESVANSAEDVDGTILSGWHMRHARLPARVAAEHSETAWTTDQAIAFLEEQGDAPFLLHVSYIKPHWPYVAPAPYHALYGPEHVMPATAEERERVDPHPVYAAFMDLEESRSFSRREVRETVIPAYMGLVAEVDNHIGRLMAALDRLGRSGDTLVVFTSDHGDYLGDHWLGDKELVHEPSVRIPLIVVDPAPQARAGRGTTCDALVESIDLAPTFLEAVGAPPFDQYLEGRSLLPWMRGSPPTGDWRNAAFAEVDYGFRTARPALGIPPRDARAWMVRTSQWKLVWHARFRPQLFDLVADPNEFDDRGADPTLESVRRELADQLFAWALTGRRHRITMSDADVEARTGLAIKRGYLIGVW